jgi:hypothetical protein
MARNDVAIVSAQISTTTRARLVQLAASADRSVSAEIRRAIAEHVAKESASQTQQEASG